MTVSTRACCGVLFLLLSACTQYAVPPHSTLEVAEGHRPLLVRGAALTIVIDTARFVIDDERAVAAHLGAQSSPRSKLFGLLRVSFASALKDEAPFGEVYVLGPSVQIPSGSDLSMDLEKESQFILYVDSLHQYRAKYRSNPWMVTPGVVGGGESQAVRHDVDYRLWDTQRRAIVAEGRVESEESIVFSPTSESYVGAAGEMAEKLTQRLGIRTRG